MPGLRKRPRAMRLRALSNIVQSEGDELAVVHVDQADNECLLDDVKAVRPRFQYEPQ